jgi:hypothetical protein
VLITFVFASFGISYKLIRSFVFNNFFVNKLCFITLEFASFSRKLYVVSYILLCICPKLVHINCY